MSSPYMNDISIAISSFFMKCVGIWSARNEFEQRLRNATLIYTVFTIIFSVWVQTRDFYYSWGDFGAILYNTCNILTSTMSIVKIFILLIHRKDFLHLVVYLRRKFLRSHYDFYEQTIMDTCKHTSAFFICIFTCFTHATIISYIISPIVANIGRNESDRLLPFIIRLDLPLSTTPYFEITFLLETLFLYQIGVCYFCFDNFLCIVNLHVAAQFRILHYRLENMIKVVNEDKNNQSWNKSPSKCEENYYTMFRTNIRQHQALIAYCDKLEEVFSYFALVQVVLFSLLMCLDGYQIIMADVGSTRRFIFIFHFIGVTSQLLMFTYSCDSLIQDSTNVAPAMYAALWPYLPMNEDGRMLRKDLVFVLMRSRVPCCLTGCGFFIVSLETYTKVLSTAVSYFTLLRQQHLESNGKKRVNIGRNESDRMLLFNIQIDLPFTTSPYFEITYLVQVLLLYQIGLCYFCFDNVLCITNIHVAGQFRILQYRLENMIIKDDKKKHDESGNKFSSEEKYYTVFKTNVRQHQALITYCKMLAKVYSLFSLGQVLLFSLIICLDGYQLIMPETPTAKRFLFLCRIIGCNSQLLMFTYSCDCLIRDSVNVAPAMYAALWPHLSMNEDGRMLRKDLILVLMRSRVPCHLTGRGFFIVSLETYTKVLSTAVSYFTLLRQRTDTAARRLMTRLCNIIRHLLELTTIRCTVLREKKKFVYLSNLLSLLREVILLYLNLFTKCLLNRVYLLLLDTTSTPTSNNACTYIACNILCLNIALFKIFILFVHKTKFLYLIAYMQTNFWQSNYVTHEQTIFDSWTRICTYFICFFTFFTEASNICYLIRPVLVNIGKNESDRILPFNMWIDLPLSITPYFEITFVMQALSLTHVGVCYICSDNILCVMNLHVAGQFRILQNRLENIEKLRFNDGEHDKNSSKSSAYSTEKCYAIFKDCIRQHQALIGYCDELEIVFRTIVLAQVLTFSLLICFVGYQVVLADLSSTRRITFINLLTSSMCQLFMFTYSCDCLTRESTNLAASVYSGIWLDLPMDEYGKMLRKDMQLVVMRSRRPCCLTANGFFPVSLETYTNILSTAMSYFTLLKQNSADKTET
ncbi:uncharacterized protein LOC143146099 [Ptiloglossa arizonensis]|uniref:uncharacterized protein LOC143146099 n=1 Tax=Ptiloglossa arizonensis TaxID=3350558 RepID=UPI003FA06670